MKTAITLITFFFASICSGQTDTLNRIDDLGKKYGWHEVYWDQHWNEVKSKEKAVYVRYTWFNKGKDCYPMGPCGKKGWLLYDKGNPVFDGLITLNGNYQWRDDQGRIRFELDFKNGIMQRYKEYYLSGILSQEFNYNDKVEDHPHSWKVIQYSKTGKIKSISYIKPD